MTDKAQESQQVKQSQAKPIEQANQLEETAVANPIPILQRAYADPRTITPNDAKTLQRTIGNRAIGNLLIQRKMTLGPVGDKYEQEADTVAKQVVSTLSSPPVTQRQEDEEDIQMKPVGGQLPSISRLQRQEDEEEIQTDRDPMLGGGELSNDLESSVQSAKSGGRPLDDTVRAPMEKAFNADFSNVKVHTGGQADNLNRAMSARAFTSGQDVFFRSGEYNPGSSGGKELIAHELTHTIQQGATQMSTMQTMQMKRIVNANQISSASNPTIQRAFSFGGIIDWVKGWLGMGPKPTAKADASAPAPVAGPQPEPQAGPTPMAEGPEPEPAPAPAPEPAAPNSDAPDEEELAKAFRETTFYYGTVGGAETLKSVIKVFQDRAKAKAKARGEEFNKPYYWPGARAKPFLEHMGGASSAEDTGWTGDRAHKGPAGENDTSSQMMDLYYGEDNTTVHELRNPVIGKHVHEQMKYTGDYDHSKSGRDAYRETYGDGSDTAEGWKWPNQKWGAEGEASALWKHPETGAALTGTMEISRIIRDGVAKYGGKLVFDGKHVIHKSNFVDGTYQGDTNKEARALFPMFAAHPGESEVPFGNSGGKLIFHWGGKETIPTQALFRSHWDLLVSKRDSRSGEDVAGPQTAAKVADQVPPESIFWLFPEGDTDKTDKEISSERRRKILANNKPQKIAGLLSDARK